jgi:hypothetical protein
MKPKVALCFSGQTRHINENPMFLEQYKEIISLFSDFDIDFYGHTWTDQPKPHPDFLHGYTEFIQTNQEQIWNAVTTKGDIPPRMFWNFLPQKSSWYDDDEFQHVLNGELDFIQWAKKMIKGTLGQIWSAHECFRLVEQSGKDYLYVVRLRWDILIQHREDIAENRPYDAQEREHDEKIIQLKEGFRHTLREITQHNRLPHDRTQRNDLVAGWDVLSVECEFIPYDNGMVFLNDHLYVIKGESFMKSGIGTKTPIWLFDSMLTNTHIDKLKFLGFGSSHTLWMEWLMNANFNILPCLPDITTPNGDMSKKENKKWNI